MLMLSLKTNSWDRRTNVLSSRKDWWDEEFEEWATEPCHLRKIVISRRENRYLDVDGEKDEEELKGRN